MSHIFKFLTLILKIINAVSDNKHKILKLLIFMKIVFTFYVIVN